MRNIFTTIASICILFGCTMEEPESSYENTAIGDIFYATFEDYGVGTRTYLDKNVKLLWHEDDRISLFRTTLNEQFRFAGATGDNSGKFTLVENDSWVTGNETSTNYAIYPYDASARLSNEEVILLNMPAEQNYAENSFGRGANTMVAAAESPSSKFLPFRNLGGYLIIKLYGKNTIVKSIKLEGNNNEILAGEAAAETRYGYLPALTMADDGATSITLNCGEGVELGESSDMPTQFWIVVPPVTFEQGFTLTITDINDNIITKSTSKQQTIVRNEVKSMSAFAIEFEAVPNENEIYYTNGSSTEPTTPYAPTAFDANIVSNIYDVDKGCWVITFDNRITSIGKYAFNLCENLESIRIPESVTYIGDRAFFHCFALKEINLPQGISTICYSTFERCESLTSIEIPETVTSFGNYAFSSCHSLIKINLPDKVTSIGDYAFSSCRSLTDIKFPNSITSIGSSSFAQCDNFKKIALPDGVKRIDDSAFQGCDNLTDIIMGKNVKSIESGAFYGCIALSNITIPDGVTTIKDNVFNGCTSLTDINIPSSITSIGEHAFSNCSLLQRVEIKDLSSWCKIEYETTTANPLHKGARLYLNGEEVINLTIPSDVTELDFAKFYGCSSIKTITIGSHVSTVTNRAFAECKNLQKVTASNGLTKIGPQAFYRCQSLTNIEIPESMTTIGNYAFCECKSLSEIMIPDNVTSIGNSAFESCRSLTSVTIGSGIQNIGKYAFNGCALENVYCHATTPPALGDTNIFWNNSLNLKIYVPWSADDSIINAYKEKYGWKDYSNIIYSMNSAD